MLIAANKFGGIAPKVADHLLPEHLASDALNVKIESGAIKPLLGIGTVSGITVDGATKTIWRNPVNNDPVSFIHVTDVVGNPLPNDAWGRVYWTDDYAATPPRYAANGQFSAPLDLGFPDAIVSAPALTITPGAGTETDPLLQESRTYLTTYVTQYGEESPPSYATGIISLWPDNGDTVSVSLPAGPSGSYNVTRVNVYRTNTGSTGTEYQRVGHGSPGGTFVDDVDSDVLGIVLPSEGWARPPTGMRGLISHPAGFLCGFHEQKLCCSVAGVPHAWPYENRYAVEGEVVAIGAYGASVLVLTNRATYIATGEDPSMLSVEKLEIGGVCQSKRAVVDMGYAIVYPTADGLTVAGVGTVPKVVTSEVVDSGYWASLNLDEMIACQYEDMYLCVCGSGSQIEGFLFNPATNDMMPISISADALYYDKILGHSFLHTFGEGTVKSFDNDEAAPLIYNWKSKHFRMPYPLSLSVAQVFADDYTAPLIFRLYADKNSEHLYEVTVTSSDPFRLPAVSRYEYAAFEVEGTAAISAVMVASSVAELAGA